MGNVTIYDVAARAGVSATTVYKAMNNLKGVSETRRASIQKLAEEMGYTSNVAAQALARRKLKIGVLFELLDSEYSRSMLDGIRSVYDDQMKNLNVAMEFAPTFEAVNKAGTLSNFEKMLTSDIDGLLFCPSMPYREFEEYNAYLEEKKLPIVLLSNRIPHLRYSSCVQYDGIALGALAGDVMNLCNPGGDYVVIVGNKDNDEQFNTIEGFRGSVRRTGGSVLCSYENRFSENMNVSIAQDILQTCPSATGILVGVSQSKMILQTLEDAGVLNRFKIVLTDNTQWARSALASGKIQAILDRHPYQMAQCCVNLLYNEIARHQSIPPDVHLPGSIILPSAVLQTRSSEHSFATYTKKGEI